MANHELVSKLNLKPFYLGLRSITGTIVEVLIKHYDFYCQQAEKIKKSRDNFIRLINKNVNLTAFNSSANCVSIKVNKSYDPDHLQTYLKKHNFTIKLIKDKPLENYLRVSVAPQKILTKLSTLLNQYFEKN
jgi:histidinol-phosphate/aromatic aminotransferase/cobyric acid decarboxylase-like protein